MSPCPSPETLGRLAHASSSGSRFAAMEAHVETCSACQDVLERLAADASACEDRGPERLPPPEQPPTIPGFVIERELGRGGMGVVYQAWQPQLARRVAIKVVSASVGIGAEDRRRWLREARAIGRVRHRNVVQLHEAGEQDGCLYLVLDLIAGGSLADRVTGPLPARVAVELMATVARAVDQIHKAGMLHLDIKPSNILLDGPPDGPWDQVTPMLADFGIARAGDDPGATATGPIGVRGTPSFMAPEQIAGDRAAIGPRSDVFALGATLYSLLTGRPPFQAASVIETLDLVRTREPAPPRTLVPGLPRDLETIALTCLRKDPRRRYASAECARGRPRSAGSMGSRSGRVRSRSSNTPVDGAGAGRRSRRSWPSSRSPWRRASWACSHSGAIPRPSARGPRMPWPVPSRATRPRPERFAISSACWRRPWMHRKCSRLNDSSNLRASYAISRRNCDRIRGFAASNLVAICDLERQLAEDFRRRGNYAESRALLMDSLDLLEGRRSGADDPDVERGVCA